MSEQTVQYVILFHKTKLLVFEVDVEVYYSKNFVLLEAVDSLTPAYIALQLKHSNTYFCIIK